MTYTKIQEFQAKFLQSDKPHEQRLWLEKLMVASSFVPNYDLRTIFVPKETNAETVECTECGQRFNNLQGLRAHNGRKHKK